MFRGLLILFLTLVVLVATVVGVVAVGMQRIAATQKQADTHWQKPPPSAVHIPATGPAEKVVLAADEEEPIPSKFDTIELSAVDAVIHGKVRLTDSRSQGKGKSDLVRDTLLAEKARARGRNGRTVSTFLTDFDSADDSAEWSFEMPRAAACEINLTYACPQWRQGGSFLVEINGAGNASTELRIKAESTRSEMNFRVCTIGSVNLPKGRTTLIVRAKPASIKEHCFMNLRDAKIILAPEAK